MEGKAMSTTNNTEALLCHYIYDPLNRLATCKLSTQMQVQRFYFQSRLATEVEGSVRRSIFQQGEQLLAQQQLQSGNVRTALLCTDPQRSVLTVADTGLPKSLVYSPYGQTAAESGLFSLLGFNGERPDSVTGHYLLGNGYRAYNPVLMRFNSPDDKSPFGEGGLNAYAYCGGDPVNRVDPTGHVGVPRSLRRFADWLSRRSSTTSIASTTSSVVSVASSSRRVSTSSMGYTGLPSSRRSSATSEISSGSSNSLSRSEQEWNIQNTASPSGQEFSQSPPALSVGTVLSNNAGASTALREATVSSPIDLRTNGTLTYPMHAVPLGSGGSESALSVRGLSRSQRGYVDSDLAKIQRIHDSFGSKRLSRRAQTRVDTLQFRIRNPTGH